jgi:hypothetical protein
MMIDLINDDEEMELGKVEVKRMKTEENKTPDWDGNIYEEDDEEEAEVLEEKSTKKKFQPEYKQEPSSEQRGQDEDEELE